MALVIASTACTLWCPHCGKVTGITCYRASQVRTGKHAICDSLAHGSEEVPNLEEYNGFQFMIYKVTQ